MLESSAHTFFAIPELAVSLSLHLPKADLAQCIRVCKAWSRHFEPILWKELDMHDGVVRVLDTIPRSRLETWARNLRHIRTVKFTYANVAQLQLLTQGLPYRLGDTVQDPDAACIHLRRIDIFGLDLDCLERMSKPLVTLLDYNPRLTHLEVELGFFEIDGVSAAVSKLYHLQSLQIHALDRDEPIVQKPYLLLQSCLALPELTELTFGSDVEIYWDHDERVSVVRHLEAIIHAASIARFSYRSTAKRITTLRLPSNSSGISNPLPLLLLKSSLLDLETRDIPWFPEDATAQEIEAVARKHCPNLKHLVCPDPFGVQDGRAARAFIRGCSGLQSFTSNYFADDPDEVPRMILASLAKYHHTTLESLVLNEPEEVYSPDLQAVLSQCKLLKRFWVMSDCNHQDFFGIAFRDISSSDWVCTELRELGLVLNRCRSGRNFEDLGEEEQQDDPSVWLTASTTKRAYQQIGQLKKLEVLAINIDRSSRTRAKEQDYKWDLTLRKGWLGEWAGLKNLRSLALRADFWSCMGQEDVEFMHEHWPLLDKIIISTDYPELRTEQHWQWLRDKRPRLRIEVEPQSRWWRT